MLEKTRQTQQEDPEIVTLRYQRTATNQRRSEKSAARDALQQKMLELIEEVHKTGDSFITGWSHERNEEIAKAWETAFSRSNPPARLRVAEQSAWVAEEAAEAADSEGKSSESLQEAEMARLEDWHAAELHRERGGA